MSEVIPAQKSEKKVLILHKWSLKSVDDEARYTQVESYVNSFSSESLPNETFYIVCGVKSGTEFSITLSKLSPKPAKATITIFVGEERKDIEIDNWTNKPISDVISSFIQADQDYDFSCEIIWKGFHDTKLPSSLNLHDHIEKFLEKPDFKDFVIKIENNEIPVHKVIVAAFSPVFLAMFNANMRETAENELVVEDSRFDIMKKVVEFMYSGKIDSELPVDDLLCILDVSEKYGIMNLKKLCEEILILKISVRNVCTIFEYAKLYEAHNLKTSAIHFMKKNKHILIQSEDFKKLCCSNSELLFE